jgi:hypothetical protein
MSDFGTMVTRIENEIHRTNIRSQVRSAIKSAIAHYEQDKPFYWNDERSEATTVVSQRYMPLPTDFVDFLGTYPLQITVNQSTYPLNRRSWDYLQLIDLDNVVGEGIPFDWAYGDQQIRLYPVPQAAYELRLFYKKRLAELSNDSDTNEWTQPAGGERLIRARAKWDLYANVIHQPEKGQIQKAAEIDAYNKVAGIGIRRKISGSITPSYL